MKKLNKQRESLIEILRLIEKKANECACLEGHGNVVLEFTVYLYLDMDNSSVSGNVYFEKDVD